MNPLQYPIGKFEWPTQVTAEQRAKYISTIEHLPQQLRDVLDNIEPDHLDIPYRDGGWSIRQMVHHIADSHMNSYVRFKLALTEDAPTIKPYDEARWAELHDSRGPVAASLHLIDGLHQRWVMVLREMTEADYERGLLHPEVGPLKLKSILALYDWHSRHHLAQIVQTRQRLLL